MTLGPGLSAGRCPPAWLPLHSFPASPCLYRLGLPPNRVDLAYLGLSPSVPPLVVLLWSPRAQRLEPQYLFQLH